MKKFFYIFLTSLVFFTACSHTKQNQNLYKEFPSAPEKSDYKNHKYDDKDRDTITLLFAGDIMAHSVNYQISNYSKIYKDVQNLIETADLSFANIEAPIDSTKPASSYPNFNMTQNYVQAAVDAGFDVFSLCNNHSNDQALDGILETIKSSEKIKNQALENGQKVYFSGLKNNEEHSFSYCKIKKNGWKILFLPVTELLNRPDYSSYINYIKTSPQARADFIEYVKDLRTENPCDLFILSFHTAEAEYYRGITESQNQFYMDLLQSGVDILWANHAHIIKDRKVIVNNEANCDKLIMYSNGNTISGQRTRPDLTSKNPDGERDNTGDGLLYRVYLKKDKNGCVKILKAEADFITTYINTAYEYVIKPLNQDFVEYLYQVQRPDWAKYIERRIKINKEQTKDLIEWQ